MGLSEAFAASVDLLRSFHTLGTSGADVHLSQYIAQHPQSSSEDVGFLSEVFEGSLQFKKIIKVVVNGFYAINPLHALRSDRYLYEVLCFLAIFKLKELGISKFKRVIVTQDPSKMHRFLSYLFDEAAINSWMREEWEKVFDASFVDLHVRLPLLDHVPVLGDLISELQRRVEQGDRPVPPSRGKTTETKPFALTKPRPRGIPVPEEVPNTDTPKAKEVPKTTYVTPLEKEALERKRRVNKDKAEKMLTEAAAPACAPAPDHLQQLAQKRTQLKEEQERALLQPTVKARPVPTHVVSRTVPIKLNAAAIMREDVFHRKKAEMLERKLISIEAGAFDEEQFLEFEARMREEEEARRLEDIEQRVLQGQLSREEAIIARHEAVAKRHEEARDMRAYVEELMAQYLKEQEAIELRNRRLVEKTIQDRENIAEAIEKTIQEKQIIRQQVKEESAELLRIAEEKAAEERERRDELIRQIKALESVRPDRTKVLDLTETSGHGLLTEMSFAELQQRLDMLRRLEAEEEELRRQGIAQLKLQRDQMLQEKLSRIEDGRSGIEQERTAKRLEKVQKMERTQTSAKTSDKATALRAQLEAKRAERLRVVESSAVTQSLRPSPAPSARSTTRLVK